MFYLFTVCQAKVQNLVTVVNPIVYHPNRLSAPFRHMVPEYRLGWRWSVTWLTRKNHFLDANSIMRDFESVGTSIAKLSVAKEYSFCSKSLSRYTVLLLAPAGTRTCFTLFLLDYLCDWKKNTATEYSPNRHFYNIGRSTFQLDLLTFLSKVNIVCIDVFALWKSFIQRENVLCMSNRSYISSNNRAGLYSTFFVQENELFVLGENYRCILLEEALMNIDLINAGCYISGLFNFFSFR